jgi:hypothetical protein
VAAQRQAFLHFLFLSPYRFACSAALQVESKQEVASGSEAEVELRAASIVAVELLKDAANAQLQRQQQQQPPAAGSPQLLSIQVRRNAHDSAEAAFDAADYGSCVFSRNESSSAASLLDTPAVLAGTEWALLLAEYTCSGGLCTAGLVACWIEQPLLSLPAALHCAMAAACWAWWGRAGRDLFDAH